MAKTVRLISEAKILGESYPKGKVLSVSESICEQLLAEGKAELSTPVKGKPIDQNEG